VSERDEGVRGAREEVEELEAARLRLSDAVRRGDHKARNGWISSWWGRCGNECQVTPAKA
jgi:hypothetical protein